VSRRGRAAVPGGHFHSNADLSGVFALVPSGTLVLLKGDMGNVSCNPNSVGRPTGLCHSGPYRSRAMGDKVPGRIVMLLQ